MSDATPRLPPEGRDEPATLPPAAAGEGVTAVSGARAQATAGPGEGVPGVPGYEIEGELGRGGMGVVYKARQLGLNRPCALKMILAGGHAGADELARFRTEAEAIARLQHPHIVQVYEIGTQEGRPFFSLEYCAGGSLDRRLNGKPIDPREAAALVKALAEAMAAAHGANVIHRDLKPANVLLSCAVGLGSPKVTDFGLAKKLDEAGQTRTGAVMGTPSYMAPEQAAGRKDVGPAADVYALGAILYECLVGRPPFVAATPLDTLLQVMEHTPTPPQVLNPAVPRDLQTVCLKCLEKEPNRRYAGAAELADELGRWLGGETIQASSHNLLGRVVAALERSQYDVQFAAWGSMLLGFAAVIGVGHLATTAVLLRNATQDAVLPVALIHAGMLGAVAALFWRSRPEGVLPRTTAERQLWCVVGGFVAACVLMGLTDRLMATPARPHEPLRLYPPFLVLSGLTFLMLGSSYWGGCYLFAAGFWVLAVVLPGQPKLGPAAFGLMWTAALATVGWRLRRLGKKAGQGRAA
jgi:hypothetical protein